MSNLLRIVPDKTGGLQRKTMEELRAQKPVGNFIELINPRIPGVPVNSINDMIRTGAQGFLGGQESTALQFQAAVDMADPIELNRLNINNYIIAAQDDPMTDEYIDRGAGVGLNLVRAEINAERAAELKELEGLDLDDFSSKKVIEKPKFQPRNVDIPRADVKIPGDIIQEKVNEILKEQSDKIVRERSPETRDEGLKVLRRTRMINFPDIGEQLAATMEKDPSLGVGKYLNNEKVQTLLNIYEKVNNFGRDYFYNLSPELKSEIIATAVLFDYFYNPGFSVTRGLVDLGVDIYNTGLNIYEGAKNMYNSFYNWFRSSPLFMNLEEDMDYLFTQQELENIKKVLKNDAKTSKESGTETPLKEDMKKVREEINRIQREYRGTAYDGDPEEKLQQKLKYSELVKKLGKLYKDVQDYREGPITKSGHLERFGAMTPDYEIPLGMNINQRLTPAELKELRRRKKLQSKTIKQFYGEAPELNQAIESAPTHNNNPTQGPIFDIPDSSPRQMQAAVLDPQDIINQMRGKKQKKSKKIKQTNILGKERSTKESTSAQTRLG